ncbi:ATP phosphoribosyltransferase regulatory subunit [Bacillus horti]|uniref:ATP phosphoribosyltransferase regulatory subunit n=1 Tax=Caldalkalibacillus horti TaxID=77523 RepID=A0ABT9W371_9BACI|nr:ATP phosphoribosyltransferase regulatory subunit [Bacillus horti]MDQ0167686.1 ATP phosphoribosyltransferase regulatory subunit [Bacillus horti]
MTKPFVFEKPLGMRDILPTDVERKEEVLLRIQKVIKRWGYERIETPTLEFYDTVGGVSATLEQKLFKLLDRSGRSLVLRPDMTTPIARVVGSLLKEQAFPLRLAYQGNVFRAQENEAGKNAEFPEVGVELIGEVAPDADAEVLVLAIESLRAAGVEKFQIAIGHVGFLHSLLALYFEDGEQQELKRHLYQKNYVGFQQLVVDSALAEGDKEKVLALLKLQGGAEILETLKQLELPNPLKKSIYELEELWAVLKLYGITEHILLDLSLLKEMDYYTGILFEGYAHSLGFPICDGGRYDQLLEGFGRPAPAIGFSLKLDRVIEVVGSSLTQKGCKEKPIRILYGEAERRKAIELAARHRAEGRIVKLHFKQNGAFEKDERLAEEIIDLRKGGA